MTSTYLIIGCDAWESTSSKVNLATATSMQKVVNNLQKEMKSYKDYEKIVIERVTHNSGNNFQKQFVLETQTKEIHSLGGLLYGEERQIRNFEELKEYVKNYIVKS